jgi:hypothetical protein
MARWFGAARLAAKMVACGPSDPGMRIEFEVTARVNPNRP